jgi:hypothetical protein
LRSIGAGAFAGAQPRGLDMTKPLKANLCRTFALAGFVAGASVIVSAVFLAARNDQARAHPASWLPADYKQDRTRDMLGADHDCFDPGDVRFAVDVRCVAQIRGDGAGWLVVRSKSPT